MRLKTNSRELFCCRRRFFLAPYIVINLSILFRWISISRNSGSSNRQQTSRRIQNAKAKTCGQQTVKKYILFLKCIGVTIWLLPYPRICTALMRPIKPKQSCLQLELSLYHLKSFAIFWQANRAIQSPKECHKCTVYTKMFKVLFHNFYKHICFRWRFVDNFLMFLFYYFISAYYNHCCLF